MPTPPLSPLAVLRRGARINGGRALHRRAVICSPLERLVSPLGSPAVRLRPPLFPLLARPSLCGLGSTEGRRAARRPAVRCGRVVLAVFCVCACLCARVPLWLSCACFYFFFLHIHPHISYSPLINYRYYCPIAPLSSSRSVEPCPHHPPLLPALMLLRPPALACTLPPLHPHLARPPPRPLPPSAPPPTRCRRAHQRGAGVWGGEGPQKGRKRDLLFPVPFCFGRMVWFFVSFHKTTCVCLVCAVFCRRRVVSPFLWWCRLFGFFSSVLSSLSPSFSSSRPFSSPSFVLLVLPPSSPIPSSSFLPSSSPSSRSSFPSHPPSHPILLIVPIPSSPTITPSRVKHLPHGTANVVVLFLTKQGDRLAGCCRLPWLPPGAHLSGARGVACCAAGRASDPQRGGCVGGGPRGVLLAEEGGG